MREQLKERLESFLNRLDTILGERNERERILIFLLPLILFGTLAYRYLIPAQEIANRTVSQRLATITAEINNYQEHLSAKTGGSRHYLEKLETENRELQQKIAAAKDINLYAEGKLQELGFVHFTPSNWSDFLHRLVTYAKKNDVTMSRFTNQRNPEGEPVTGFKKVLTVDFNSTGYYQNMVRFIRDIENDRAVTDIEKLSIESGPRLRADFTISLWGLVQ